MNRSKPSNHNAETLWSDDPRVRLEVARGLDRDTMASCSRVLSAGCPVEPWPYGNPTVANPFILTLGVSPGGSPAKGDTSVPAPGGHKGPTFGKAHEGIYYPDGARFWDKLRVLAETCLAQFSTHDAHALYGHLNLDTGSAGSAHNAQHDPKLGVWILDRIANHLRPRFVVMLGLKGYVQRFPEACTSLNGKLIGEGNTGKTDGLAKPHRVIPFSGYAKSKLCFREWDVRDADGRITTYVMWPQHPSRPPFGSMEIWKTACSEFAARHREVLTAER